MHKLSELKSAADELLRFAENKKEAKEAEAYVAAHSAAIYRIAYHSKIPSNGVEEAKVLESHGLSLRILFRDGKYGMGSCDNEFSPSEFRAFQEPARCFSPASPP